MSLPAPRPVRDRVILASDGYPGRVRFTTHYFVGAVPVRVDGDAYWSFEYECLETGARRRFGLMDRTSLSKDEIDAEIAEEGN